MNVYVQSVSAKKEGDAREKMLPIDVLAQAMITHGEEFEPDSLFGNCLLSKFLFLEHSSTVIFADTQKKWDKRMRKLLEYRMHMLPRPARAGSSRWNGL